MTKLKITIRDMILVAMFAALIAVGAFITIPIGPVPITLQLLFTTLAGVLLGCKRGTLAALVYMLVGLIGVPVFSGGSGGFSSIVSPTFGFIIAFIFGTGLTGYIAERIKKVTFVKLLGACYAGIAIIYLIGVPYFYFIMNFYLHKNISVWASIFSCFIVFIPGDAFKCIMTSIIGVKMLPILRKVYNVKGIKANA